MTTVVRLSKNSKQMQIKTITCHEVYNHGASLQEYALLYYLNGVGHSATTIHYKPDYLSRHFKFGIVSNPKFDLPFIKQLYLLAKLPSRLKALQRKRAFDTFAKKYISTDAVLYHTNEDLKKNVPVADAFICGSDQIWNSFFQNGKDPAFYLDFVPNNRLKISYAASFAIDEIAEDLKPFVQQKVARLDHISVREISGKKILAALGINVVTQVLDPVFLLSATHWKEKFVSPISGDYIFIYDFDSNPIIEKIAQKMAQDKGLKIFTVNENITYSDKNFYLEGPEKFLSLMYHAQFVLTNSFHSVAFSLLFKKQFAVVNRADKINTRMRDLLVLFDLSALLISTENDFDQLPIIDFNNWEERLNPVIERSKLFLKASLVKQNTAENLVG
jgi:hypothetical protein